LHAASIEDGDMTHRRDDIEPLVRAVYGLTALKRDMPRLAGFDHPVGLVPLAVVHRLAPARVKDVAAALQVDLSVASRQVAALATAGYLRREPDPEDRRAHRVSLTEVGEAALERAHERIVAVFSAALADWGEDELTTLTSALTRLRADYERAATLPTTLPTITTPKEAA
jgi:DNA-binding MarR family transcriptional regulator